MEIVGLNRSQLKHEYGLNTQRLLPWPALNAPFEAAWCVMPAGTSSTPHDHHEYEVFVAVNGDAVVECDGERKPFRTGDVVFFSPGQNHHVRNDSDRVFEFYSVWWDRDLSERFLARDAVVAQPAR